MSRVPLRSEIAAAQAELESAGVPGARVDAEILAADQLRVPRTRLGLHPLVDEAFVEQYRATVAQRATRIPLQHLLGTAHLAGVDVAVGPGVFIPRPETESLVMWALEAIRDVPAPVVVDLFTGSGAIALALATARPDARVIGVERSPGALSWARRNTETHRDGGGTSVELRGVDVFDPRGLADLDGSVDLVTANPPYVPAGTPVEPEVADHDPAEAVFAGPDGLDVIRPLVGVIAGLLTVGGVLAVEHDDSQGESVPALLGARRILAEVTDHPDLAGRPRFATARRVSLPAR